ncbi:MAG: Flp pilus assembly complex ATPase component TadA, partial [Candidatus Pacebacteria bacterium]|nr:Flp pilus assembly complex ATPase component TadA [Candidatus Paceibacterota bacterium]
MIESPLSHSASGNASLLTSLIQQHHISEEQAELVRRRVGRAQVPTEQAVIDLGFASEEQVYAVLAQCSNLEFVNLAGKDIAEDATQKVSAKVAFHYKLVPIKLEKQTLTAAFASPPSMRNREHLRVLLGVRLAPLIATPSDIRRALKRIYGIGADTVMQIRKDRSFQKDVDAVVFDGFENQDLAEADDAETASIIHLVNQLLLEALELDATDIHIEPFQDVIKVRYRIDGMLRDIPTPPGLRELHNSIVSRLKIMANLNIAEQRLPHDGRIRVHVGNEEFDLRVSILPTRFGETLCLRILNRQAIFLDLSELGLNEYHLRVLRQLVDLPHGIILVTGPTGSGKTTTLYAALARVRHSERKIITVEDPVEYQLDGTSQIQIRADIGLTFASGLRSILRHDPDIILVGEIRDSETAEIAIRSALTGHLVLSTLHTNDSVGAVNRLIDMGVEPYLVASSLVAALAQRLVRRICAHCKELDTNVDPLIREEM